jgi:hypothetical protein
MMNKTKSARVNLLRFAFILPLLAVVLLAFRDVVQQQPQPQPWLLPVQSGGVNIDTVMTPVADTTVFEVAHSQKLRASVAARVAEAMASGKVKTVSSSMLNTMAVKHIDTVPVRVHDTARKEMILPQDIESIDIDKTNNRITFTLKNGSIDSYNLLDEKDRKAFKDKYGGDLPVPAKPPVPTAAPDVAPVPGKPAAPALAPVPTKSVIIIGPPQTAPVPAKPVAPGAAPVPAKPAAPPIPEARANSEDCFNNKGYCITIADNYGECVVIVKNRQFKIVEAATLTDWQSNKRYEDKYGPIPQKDMKKKPVTSKDATLRFEATSLIDPTAQLEPEVYNAPPVKSKIEEVIDQHTSKADLEEMDKRFRQHGCYLTIVDMQYSNGLLVSLHGKLTKNNGKQYGSFYSRDLSKAKIRLRVVNYLNGNTVYSFGPAIAKY